MIRLDISVALFLYLLFTVIGVFLLWIFFVPRLKRQDFIREEDYLWQCSICTNVYIDSKNEAISRCPQCHSLNERKNKGGRV